MENVDDLIDPTQHSYLIYSIYTFQINIGNNILIPVVDNILEKTDDRLTRCGANYFLSFFGI